MFLKMLLISSEEPFTSAETCDIHVIGKMEKTMNVHETIMKRLKFPEVIVIELLIFMSKI